MIQTVPITPVNQPYSAGVPVASAAGTLSDWLASIRNQTGFYAQACSDLSGQVSGLPPGAQVYKLSDGNGQTAGYVAVVQS